MSKNSLYANEIASANNFIISHSKESKLQRFLDKMKEDYSWLSHSDRWSMCYDFLDENYPEVTGTIVTGMTYWLEN